MGCRLRNGRAGQGKGISVVLRLTCWPTCGAASRTPSICCRRCVTKSCRQGEGRPGGGGGGAPALSWAQVVGGGGRERNTTSPLPARWPPGCMCAPAAARTR